MSSQASVADEHWSGTTKDPNCGSRPNPLAYFFSAGVAAILAIAGCASTLVLDGNVDQRQAAAVEASVARIRELNFTRPVPLVVKSPDQAEQMMVAQIARDHSDQDLRIGGASGAMTGLYPPHLDLKGQTLALLRDEVIGFYNPDTKQMVIVEKSQAQRSSWVPGQSAARRRTMSEMVLAHELTHALQDQHFGINAMLRRVKDNDDETLALKSVAEGDATIAGFGYVAGHLDPANIGSLVTKLDSLSPSSKQIDDRSRESSQVDGAQGHLRSQVPHEISVPMLFQYSGGSRFVAEAWRRGGWTAVDNLYRNPPRSSQQIMQPELYYDHPSPPVRIQLSGYQQLMKGWKKVDDDTYGELLLRLLLQRNLTPRSQALATLPRWAGDRIITLQKGNELTLLWLIVFHDRAAAREFCDTYRLILDHLRGESNPHGLDVHDDTVFAAIGPGARDFQPLKTAVWKASRISQRVEGNAGN